MSSIAVLGGGISGLSAAYYLSRMAPSTTKIILIEGKERMGGWIQSRRVAPGKHNGHHVNISNDKDSILFEAGPRSLRPEGSNGAIMLEMIQHLNLNNERLLAVPKSDPSVKHRYIYYNGEINQLPSNPASLLFNKPPIFKSVILAGAFEPFRASRFDKQGHPKDGKEDESMYSFMKRRFNEHTATNLMGALAHGVYAGDVKQLSIQSTFRMLYEAEKNHGSVVLGMMRGAGNTATMRERGMATRARKHDPAWFSKMEKMSVIGFKDGLEVLPSHIRAYLEQCPNVEIVQQDPVVSIQPLANGKESKIKTSRNEYTVDHVVSTIPSRSLERALDRKLPHLSHNPVSDVAVVNVAYDHNQIKLGYDGFGFLTPHRDTKYRVPVPGTLGVIFDSNAMPGQEQSETIKMTAMLGGADWQDAFGKATIDELDPEVAYERTMDIMSVFLNINEKPTHSMVNLQKQCIPQYIVGHEGRMRELHYAIKKEYGHLLSVTGASYLGVSVPDCIKNSRMLVEELVVSGALGSRDKVVTGLGKTVEGVSTEEMKDSARISQSNTQVIWNS